jgi:hypothetical protein
MIYWRKTKEPKPPKKTKLILWPRNIYLPWENYPERRSYWCRERVGTVWMEQFTYHSPSKETGWDKQILIEDKWYAIYPFPFNIDSVGD